MLAYAGVCWRMLAYAGVCWRMLTYAGVCGRMLMAYADPKAVARAIICEVVYYYVCLTYADVC
jgi:hypothetical protein